MSDIIKHEPSTVSADTLAHVLGTGDISKLSTQQRVEYLVATCRSLGLNPLTRPFQFLTLNGKVMLYATKDCTDQLRTVHGITLHLVDKSIDSGLFIVTARARHKDGREDEDVGAVALGTLAGESRANAIMKATTKAKRRVTLSICGLGGMPDESELDGMPGAQTFDAEEEPPVAPIRAAAAPTPRAARKVADAQAEEAYAPTETPHDKWMAKLRAAMDATTSAEGAEEVARRPSVTDYYAKAAPAMRRDIDAVLANGYGRHAGPQNMETPDDLEIAGEHLLAAG